MACTARRRYSLDECRRVLRWYADADARLAHAVGVAERRAILEWHGWVRCTRVLRLGFDRRWHMTVEHVEITDAGRAALAPHAYDPRPDLAPSPVLDGYDPCRVCGDVLRATVHTTARPEDPT